MCRPLRKLAIGEQLFPISPQRCAHVHSIYTEAAGFALARVVLPSAKSDEQARRL